MSDYAVVNPATGETLATYPTITDAALETAIATADAAYRAWRDTPVAERGAHPPRRRAAPRAARRARRDHRARDGQAARGRARRGRTSPPTSPSSTPTTPSKITGDQPIDILGEGTAVIRRSPLGRAARASCRGTSRTTRWPVSRRRTS